jgi:hypothetical protein
VNVHLEVTTILVRKVLRPRDKTKKFTHCRFLLKQTFWLFLHVLCYNIIRIIKFFTLSWFLINEQKLTDSSQNWVCLLRNAAPIKKAKKAKAVPLYATKALGERGIAPTHSWPQHYMGASGKRRSVPIVQEAGWAAEPVWTERLEEKSFRLCRGSNLDRPVVQPIARHYTGWATQCYWESILK